MYFKRKSLLATLAFTAATLIGCASEVPTHRSTTNAESLISIVPAPAALERREGVFVVDSSALIVVANEQAKAAADQFVALLHKTRGFNAKVKQTSQDAEHAITFALDENAGQSSDEGYSLDVSTTGVRVSARTGKGLFYGAMSLWQLLVDGNEGRASIPALHIEDAPRFGWRGLMLDSARHFQSVDEIKLLLDAMAQHKLNVFHWHLTDDQGWRVEIKRYPKLTETGGCRIPLGDAGRDPRNGEPRPYCGYYTQEQVREIVCYAAERHITVVPEIDVPGHAQAAIAAYPEFGVLGSRPSVSAEWGINTYLFNVEESTVVFLENVFGELMDLFPGPYIHVGGDEAAKDQWKASARVQQRMHELGVADEDALQAWLIQRIETYLARHGCKLIGWDEILEGGVPPEATVMSWRGTEGGIEAARHGNDVVMSPNDQLYFNYLQSDSPNDTPGRPTLIPLKKVYDYEPVPSELTRAQAAHILGAQANVWTEHLRTPARVQRAIFPRAAALSETVWTPIARRDWAGFLKRLPAQLARYRALGVDYSTTAFEVTIDVQADPATGNATVSLSNQLGIGEIRYTVDGSEPTATSAKYAGALALTLPSELRANTFVGAQSLAPVTSRRLDVDALRRRSNHELASCSQGLPLRLEDDGPFDGARALFTVDIFNPCWLYKDAALDGIARIGVRAGRMPYNFQLWNDEANRKSRPPRSRHGEFEVRAGCDGELLASAELPPEPNADGFIDLELALPARSGHQDLCLYFTGDTRPTYWVIDEVRLQPHPH
jgi:hexosaminidase